MSLTIEAISDNAKPSTWRNPIVALTTTLLTTTAVFGGITQYIAYRLDYDPGLGKIVLGRMYLPWAWLEWSQEQWAAYHQTLFREAYAATMLAAVGAIGIGIAVSSKRSRPRRYNDTHGTARFATPADMKRSNFLHQDKGVYIGGWLDSKGRLQYLRHNGSEHIALIAPTRSGKGVGPIIATLLSYEHSTVVYDEKDELYSLTAGWRSTGANNVILRWRPGESDGSCARYNFLDSVRLGTMHEVSDAQNIAIMLCDPEGKGLRDHWEKTGYALLVGVILHVMYQARDAGMSACLPHVAIALSNPNQTADELYADMAANTYVNGEQHVFIASEAASQLNRDVKERTSVHSSAVTAMALFKDPIVVENTSVSDFWIDDLMNYDRPVSLYVHIPAVDLARLRPLWRLMVTSIIKGLTAAKIGYNWITGRPVKPHKHDMLVMFDEFPSSKKIEAIETSGATIAAFGIRYMFIMQDREQLIKEYGQNEMILSNCHIKIIYAPNSTATARWITEVLGKKTVNVEDISESGKKMGGMNSMSRSIKQVQRELMTEEEVMSLKAPVKDGDRIVEPGEMLIWQAGMKARVYGTQLLYFRDPVFDARRRILPPQDKQVTRGQQAVVEFVS